MRISIILTSLFVLLSLGSCQKYLDVSNELAEELDYEKIFNNPEYTRRFIRVCYTGIPNTSDFARGLTGYMHPWPVLSDEIKSPGFHGNGDLNNRPFIASNNWEETRYGRWDLFYQLIRQANVFLDKSHAISKVGDTDFISEQELLELQAQARFFRAYYHYLLFEQYGPIPIMDYTADPTDKEQDFARNSVDEVVNFVDKEMLYCSQVLKAPNLGDVSNAATPTQGTALAIRARLWMYAASPLFNGGFTEALTIKNPDGKQLFPTKDNSKWQKALAAVQDFIDYANQGNYELFKVLNPDGSINPDESIYQVLMGMNKEIIFARSDIDWGNVSSRVGPGLDTWNIPRGVRGGSAVTGFLAVTQELVDDFFMNDGLSIEESPKYKETGYSLAGDDITGRTDVGTWRMFINREPRFYQTVFYNRRRWHIGNETVTFHRGGNSSNEQTTDYPLTGHLLYKRMSRRVYNQSPNPLYEYRPAIIHRLAEFYLLYAEALNEVNPNDNRILEYVDKVRVRAGIPKLKDIKPHLLGNQEELREAIRREMRVELATEGQRFFDVRRWMLAETPGYKQGGPLYGMNMNATENNGFYNRIIVENRAFTKAMYLYPIPLNQIQNSSMLVQNPLY